MTESVLGLIRFGACLEHYLGRAATLDVLNDKHCKILVAVADADVFDIGGRFARPSSLSRGSITVESRPRCRYPVVESLAGVSEVTVPAEWCRAVLMLTPTENRATSAN
jgi:hypothetical protein